MRPFGFLRPTSVADAVRAGGDGAAFLAGGTELVPWLKDGIANPTVVADLDGLGLAGITIDDASLRIGATTRLADIADHPGVRRDCPALAQAIDQSASAAIRNQASLAGNLMQGTRCPYFRTAGAPEAFGCELRAPGSGCAARTGDQRAAALFTAPTGCVAVQPSDPAVALVLAEALVRIVGPAGERTTSVESLFALGAGTRALAAGELITEIVIPRADRNRRSRFGKVRDRASFDFALVSAAVGGTPERPAIVVGAVQWGPRRCQTAEAALAGGPLGEARLRAALGLEFAGVVGFPGNRFKVELAVRLVSDLLLADLNR